MSSRALSLATMLMIVVFAGDAGAQNLEAGKSAAQMFSGNCASCHKAVRGLLRTVPPGSLPGFLRQHYTTGPDMAGMLSAYLISRGATDQRSRPERPRSSPGDVRSEPRQADRQGRKPLPQAAQPDPSAQNEPQAGKDRYGRRIVRPAAENPETARSASEEASQQDRRKPRDRKKLSKQKPAPDESAKAGAAGQGASPSDAATKPETAKTEPSDVTPAKEKKRLRKNQLTDRRPRHSPARKKRPKKRRSRTKRQKWSLPRNRPARNSLLWNKPQSRKRSSQTHRSLIQPNPRVIRPTSVEAKRENLALINLKPRNPARPQVARRTALRPMLRLSVNPKRCLCAPIPFRR